MQFYSRLSEDKRFCYYNFLTYISLSAHMPHNDFQETNFWKNLANSEPQCLFKHNQYSSKTQSKHHEK